MKPEAEDLRTLLDRIVACGPRAVGSEGERRCAALLAHLLGCHDLEVRVQPFGVSRWPLRVATYLMPVLAAACMLAAALFLPDRPVLSTVILAAMVAAVIASTRLHRFGDRLFDMGRQVRSANIVARTRRWSAERPSLLFMAHYDSKSQPTPIAVRLGALFMAVGSVVVLLGVALSVAFELYEPGAFTLWLPATIGLVSLLLLFLGFPGNRSPGAMDNGSGLAVMLALADELPGLCGQRFNLMFVATGAEELGLGGALRFAQEFGGELDPERTLCINFDILGGGGKVRLAGSKRSIGSEGGNLERRLRAGRLPVILGAGMDHMRLEAAGFRAFSLTQSDLRSLWHVHGPRDTIDRVGTDQLARIAGAVGELAKSL
jgi:hypothetical protein